MSCKIEIPVKRLVKTFLILFTFFLSHACTETPTNTVDVPAKRNTLEGRVRLEDFLNPADTYIWLEGFNLGTRAEDRSGEYRIQLPERGFQSVNPSGVEGVFKLYFYSANYFLKTLDLVILNGELVYGKGDISIEGQPLEHPALKNFLQIRTELSQTEIISSYDSTLTVSVILTPVNLADTVDIVFPDLAELSAARVFFKGITVDRNLALATNRFTVIELGNDPIPYDEVTSKQEVRDRPLIVEMDFEWRANLAEAGEYEVLPYLIMARENIPQELLETLGIDLSKPFENYLNMPFGVRSAKLVVTPAE